MRGRFGSVLAAAIAAALGGCASLGAPQVTVSGVPFDTVATGTVDYAEPPPDSVAALVEQAEVVVRAVAREVEMREEDAATPVTEQTFEVVEVVVGDLAAGDRVTLSMLGGVVGRVFYEFESEPQFATDAEYLLVLRSGPDDLFRVVGPTAGRYRIEDGTLLDHEADLLADEVMRAAQPLHRRLRSTTTLDPTQGELLSGMDYAQAVDAIRAATDG